MNLEQMQFSSLSEMKRETKERMGVLSDFLSLLKANSHKEQPSDYNIKQSIIVEAYMKGEQLINNIDIEINKRLENVGFDFNSVVLQSVLKSITEKAKK